MKCRYCNGTGEHINDANRMTTCEFCGGIGVIKPLTNEEYIRRCDDATLAFKIWELIKDGNADSLYHIETWLKEKHE